MSLQKTITTKEGFDVTYWKIVKLEINISHKCVEATLVGFKDSEMKEQNRGAMVYSYVFKDEPEVQAVEANEEEGIEGVEYKAATTDYTDFLGDVNVRNLAYEKIKVINGWNESVDI